MTIGHAHSNHLKHDPTRGFGVFESYLAKKRASIAESKIPIDARKGRVLDIGCGAFPFFLVNTNFNEKYGVDSIVHKKDFGKSIVLKSLDIEKEKLPFKNNYFDTVVMLAVFEHIDPNRLKFVLDEAYRVLTKNGVFIITTPSPWSDNILWFLSRVGLVSKVEIDDHKHALTSSTIKTILSQAGFEKRKINNGYFEAFFNMWFIVKK